MPNNENQPIEPFDPVTGQLTRELTPLESFYHLFQVEKHSYETDAQYEERLRTKEIFVQSLEEQGLTPSQLLASLQQ